MPLEDLIRELARAFGSEGADAARAPIRVLGVDLEVPVEARLERDGALSATLPRGMWFTGFAAPHGRLRLSIGEVALQRDAAEEVAS